MKTINDIAEEIERIGKKIEQAKTELNRNKGRHDELMSQLENLYKFSNIDDAKQELEKILNKIDKMESEICEKFEDLKNEMNN